MSDRPRSPTGSSMSWASSRTSRGRRAKFRDAQITMAHGAGGKATQGLIEGLFVPAFGGETLAQMADAGEVVVDGARARVHDRLLRRRSRCGSRAARSATSPSTAPSTTWPCRARDRSRSRSRCARGGARRRTSCEPRSRRSPRPRPRAGVEIVAGDTKVVERGHADGMYVCTAGIGRRDPRARAVAGRAPPRRPHPRCRAAIGEHGTAIMLARGEFELDAEIESDTRSLWPAVDALLEAAGPELRCMRDATRGGVASVLNELARASGVAMVVRESAVPVKPAVAGAAEILGIDPMYVANEGKLVAFVAPEAADAALAALRAVPGCEDAAEIGEVRTEPPGMVLVETSFGGRRVMDQLVGDPLPRIC